MNTSPSPDYVNGVYWRQSSKALASRGSAPAQGNGYNFVVDFTVTVDWRELIIFTGLIIILGVMGESWVMAALIGGGIAVGFYTFKTWQSG